MSLFGMIGDVVGTLKDMKQLGGMQDDMEKAVEDLIASGKCPDALKSAFEGLKGLSKDAPLEESMGKLKAFGAALADHADVLPGDLAKKAAKFKEVVDDIEDKKEDIEKLTGKKL